MNLSTLCKCKYYVNSLLAMKNVVSDTFFFGGQFIQNNKNKNKKIYIIQKVGKMKDCIYIYIYIYIH
jgi:hypothetical protein